MATRFVDEFGDDLRFVAAWKKWVVWDGKRFRVDAASVDATRKGREYAKGLWKEFADCHDAIGDKKEVQKFLTGANRKSGLDAFVALSRCDSRVVVSVEELNKNMNLLNLQNGTYDMEKDEFREHRRSDLLTQIADVEYHPEAQCLEWLEALDIIFDGDPDLIRYVQKLFGYSIAGGDTGEHLLPIAYGNGNNGKSTIWNTLLSLLGEYGVLAAESLLMGVKQQHPTEKAQLYQKRFVAISEPEANSKLREARVKELTGDEFVSCRRMFEDNWNYRRTHTFFMSTNHLPRIDGADDGIWRRLKLIPFTVNIKDKVEPVKDYHKWLAENEGPGILNWLLEGYRLYKAEGLDEPECVLQATDRYRGDQDELGQFFSECCVVDPKAVAPASALFDAYQKWGGKISKTMFGRQVSDIYEKDKPTSGEHRRKTIYRGVGLVSEIHETPEITV